MVGQKFLVLMYIGTKKLSSTTAKCINVVRDNCGVIQNDLLAGMMAFLVVLHLSFDKSYTSMYIT